MAMVPIMSLTASIQHCKAIVAFTPTLKLLKTGRLILRPMVESDALTVVTWRNSQHIASMSMQAAHSDLTVEDHLQWFSQSRSSRLDYILELRVDHRPIGSVSLVWREYPGCHFCGEIGKYIGDQSQLGKGYASEAADCWLQYGFLDIGLDCVIARTRATNTANIKINEKLGFTIEPLPVEFGDQSDDWIFMRLKKADWLINQNKKVSP